MPAKSLQSCTTLRDATYYSFYQAPLSMGFSRQEYWSGLPRPPPGVFPVLLHRWLSSCLCPPRGERGKRALWGLFLNFWLHLLCSVAHTILVPQPGIKPVLRAVEVWSQQQDHQKIPLGPFFFFNKGTNPIHYFANKSPSSQSYGFSSSHV